MRTFLTRVFLQTTLLISCIVRVKIIKISSSRWWRFELVTSSAVVDTTFVDIYVDTKNIPTCRYNIQHIDKRTMEK